MKRVLWCGVFIIVTFAVRASENPKSWSPPPPSRRSFPRSSRDSHHNHQRPRSFRHSEWLRMKRRASRPHQRQRHHSSSGHRHRQNNDDDRHHRQEHYDKEYEEQYSTPPNREDLLHYRHTKLHPTEGTFSYYKRPYHNHTTTGNQKRRRRVKPRYQRRKDTPNTWPEEDDNFPLQTPGLSIPYDKIDDDAEKVAESTTLEPLHISDVKVPTAFLRIEYMISFSFLGLCYGLGFLVMFQSLCVTTAKITVFLVYYALLKAGIITKPYTLQDALEQMPPI